MLKDDGSLQRDRDCKSVFKTKYDVLSCCIIEKMSEESAAEGEPSERLGVIAERGNES